MDGYLKIWNKFIVWKKENSFIYNFEATRVLDRIALNKILAYNGKIFSSELNRGDSYGSLKRVEQIVIVGKSKIKLEDTWLNQNYFKGETLILSDMQKICVIRVDKVGDNNHYIDKEREKFKNFIKFLGTENQSMRDKLASEGDEIIMEMNEYLKDFSKNPPIPPGYDRIEFRYAQGIERGKEDTARNMLNENCEINLISKVTGLSKKQIEILQKENQNLKVQII